MLTLDDRIYCLQRSNLPEDLSIKLTEADIAYVQGRDFQSMLLVTFIESECQTRRLPIYQPYNAPKPVAISKDSQKEVARLTGIGAFFDVFI